MTSIGHLLKYCAGFEVLVLYLINSCYFTHPPPSFCEFTILFYYTILHLPQLHSTPHFSFAYILLITVMHFYINAQYIISASRGLSVHMIHTKKIQKLFAECRGGEDITLDVSSGVEHDLLEE